jgi:hypothetical protein
LRDERTRRENLVSLVDWVRDRIGWSGCFTVKDSQVGKVLPSVILLGEVAKRAGTIFCAELATIFCVESLIRPYNICQYFD